MMTSITDTLKLALDALEGADQIDCDMQAAITAIKQALAQPEQAPTSELHSCPYAEEIHGNYEKVCDCDEEATRQCAQDI
jgi:hypothetical protein